MSTVPLMDRPQPDAYRARTGHRLMNEKSKVFKQLHETKLYADQNNMKLNLAKTKLMLFNPCTSKDFMPEMVVENNIIELVEQVKLLGVVLSSNLSWSANTDYIVDEMQQETVGPKKAKKARSKSF